IREIGTSQANPPTVPCATPAPVRPGFTPYRWMALDESHAMIEVVFPRWRAGLVLAAVLLIASSPTQAVRAPPVDDQIEHGFDLAYNLDYVEAVDVLKQAAVQDPASSGVQRALATATWLHLLFTRGTVLVDDYLGPVTKKDVNLKPPPTEVASEF